MKTIESDMKKRGFTNISDYFKWMLEEQEKQEKQQEAFKKKSRIEQLKVELDKAYKDYEACAFVADFEGMERCIKDIKELESEKNLLENEKGPVIMTRVARKKPVEINFVQYDGENKRDLSAFLKNDLIEEEGILKIHTLEGNMAFKKGDYIIQGVKGEFYPCDEEIFHQTYDILEGTLREMKQKEEIQ